MKPIRSGTSLVTLALILSAATSHAVIVAGANGGGNNTNNTTRAQLEIQQGRSAGFYDNVINYSDATGIYLGYVGGTPNVWVMSAGHVTADNSDLSIAGLPYTFQQRTYISNGDIQLIRYSRVDSAVPTFGAVKLATSVPVANASLVLAGIGLNRTENAATSALVSDATSTGAGTGYHWNVTRIKRFGTNNVFADFPDSLEIPPHQSGTLGTINFNSGTTTAFYTQFDSPSAGGFLTSNEATGSLGDSGGGAFRFNGSEYELAGIFTSVTSFTGQDANSSAFLTGSVLTDISTYSSQILSVTGTLIPEPTATGMFGFGLILLTLRRKR